MTATVGATRSGEGQKGPGMEGRVARWYARNTEGARTRMRDEARALAGSLAPGSRILEVEPGPGYLAIELARLGDHRVAGLDISKTFVALAAENAREAGVDVAFRHGDAASLPFDDGSFALIVCRAAFKNFRDPVRALSEMHRVLEPGGKAVILDLRPDASPADIAAEVAGMGLSRLNALITRLVFKHMLLRRAHSRESFSQMAARTPFRTCAFREESISLEVTLAKF